MAHGLTTGTVMLTAGEFMEHPAAHERTELVRGRIHSMTPTGGSHGLVSGNVFRLLSTHVYAQRLGVCFADSTGYALPNLPNTVRAPDASFVREGRLPHDGIRGGWLELAPDLAVEVLSPSESSREIEEKLADYRVAGAPVVWVIDAVTRSVRVVVADGKERLLAEGDVLSGDGVIPGFTCAVRELFEGLAPG